MHRLLHGVALLSLMATAFNPSPTQAAESNEAPIRLLVPAYFYPAGEGLIAWKKLIASAEQAPVVAIVNPDSGPGKRVDAVYHEIFQRAKPSKIKLIGYVTLSYAERPISAVKADIDSWLHFYPEVAGIFFDEQPSQAEQSGFAREAFAYARQKLPQGTIVSNPGVPCAREYFDSPAAPTICVFEHKEGFDKLQLPAWSKDLPPERTLILLYDVPNAAAMRDSLHSIMQKRAGYLYVTNRGGGNPWDGLPAYWDEEVAAVKQLNEKRR